MNSSSGQRAGVGRRSDSQSDNTRPRNREGSSQRVSRGAEDLDVFKLAHELVLKIHEISRSFPREEAFGLTSQLRRAAISVPANLVAGSARNNRSEYRQFVGIAKGAAAEASYHLLVAKDLGYAPREKCDELRDAYDRICRMLARLAQALSRQDRPEPPHAHD